MAVVDPEIDKKQNQLTSNPLDRFEVDAISHAAPHENELSTRSV
jgi:hypothetical protein